MTVVAGYQDMVEAARRRVREVTVEDLAGRLERGGAVLVDVREADEYDSGAIEGARLIPRGVLESSIAAQIPDPATPVVLYCEVGARSAFAALTLEQMGYRDVVSLQGGFQRWKEAGLPWSMPAGLSREQRRRYSRHTLLSEVGEEGQQRLLSSRVLLVGAGGLGSPAALYLAAAGVGTLGIIDDDVVELSNLQRQILHTVDRIGRPKVESAREALRGINPDVTVEAYGERLTAGNVLEVMSGYDVVVDGGDNFPTRYLVNDASLHLRIPVVHGAIFRFEGQASVFHPYAGPCYRCLFPLPPPPELAPSCAEAGVLGVLPGIIGSLEAMEAIKLLLGIGEPLVGRLLTYDALTQEFRLLTMRRNPECPACADEASPPPIVEYDQQCRPAIRTG